MGERKEREEREEKIGEERGSLCEGRWMMNKHMARRNSKCLEYTIV